MHCSTSERYESSLTAFNGRLVLTLCGKVGGYDDFQDEDFVRKRDFEQVEGFR